MPVGYAAILVDVVDSRRHASRRDLQAAVVAACVETGRRSTRWGEDELDAFAVTVGDEVQATYARLGAALRAATELRLLLLVDHIEVRAGIGWGEIVVRDPDRAPLGQDGPAWWSARAALEASAAATAWSDYPRRTVVAIADDEPTGAVAAGLAPPRELDLPDGALLDGYVALLDRSIALLDAEDATVVLNDLDGGDTSTVAARLGVGENAVSMRRSRNHLREVIVALRALTPMVPS